MCNPKSNRTVKFEEFHSFQPKAVCLHLFNVKYNKTLKFEEIHFIFQMRMTDNVEIPALFKLLQNLQVKISERPLSDPYSVKARTLLHAHLSRLGLNPDTLDKDRIQCLQ